jgi:hypothetical protein
MEPGRQRRPGEASRRERLTHAAAGLFSAGLPIIFLPFAKYTVQRRDVEGAEKENATTEARRHGGAFEIR